MTAKATLEKLHVVLAAAREVCEEYTDAEMKTAPHSIRELAAAVHAATTKGSGDVTYVATPAQAEENRRYLIMADPKHMTDDELVWRLDFDRNSTRAQDGKKLSSEREAIRRGLVKAPKGKRAAKPKPRPAALRVRAVTQKNASTERQRR